MTFAQCNGIMTAARVAARRGFRIAMRVKRFRSNPIVYPGMGGRIGSNINGPSLIRVPDWFPNPLAKYYLYFAHHQGRYTRLAYADRLRGPWKVYTPGTLNIRQTPCVGHIASPDAHVDHKNRRIIMYYHGPIAGHLPDQSCRISARGVAAAESC